MEIQYRQTTIDFVFDGQQFEFYTKGMGSSAAIRVLVDGLLISTSTTSYPSNGSLYYTLVDLGSRANRHITIECAGNTFFGGINISPTDSIGKFANTNPTIQIFGDSFTEGGSSQSNVDGYAANLGRILGACIFSSGVGATGYIAAPTPKIKLRDRLPADLISADVYIIANGINDTANTDAAIIDEAGLCIDYIKTNGKAAAKIVVLSPWSPSRSTRLSLNSALKSLSHSKGVYFIDSMGDNTDNVVTGSWLTGTGRVGTTTGVGNCDLYVLSDGTHPTTEGHEFLVYKLAKAILDLGI
jgi:lysophospholipase L1-like esterase